MTGAPVAGAVRVLLVDDQPLVRSGLRVLIADTTDLEVVGEAGTGAEAVRLAGELGPDVVVMDIRMPGMDGIEATRLITADSEAVRVLVLTTFDEDDHVYGALRAGASGFAVKDMALEDILAAIRVVAAGDALIAPGVTRRLIADIVRGPVPRRRQGARGRSRASPSANARCSPWWGGAGRTRRSPRSCSSRRPRPSRTWRACSANSEPGTGSIS